MGIKIQNCTWNITMVKFKCTASKMVGNFITSFWFW